MTVCRQTLPRQGVFIAPLVAAELKAGDFTLVVGPHEQIEVFIREPFSNKVAFTGIGIVDFTATERTRRVFFTVSPIWQMLLLHTNGYGCLHSAGGSGRLVRQLNALSWHHSRE